MMPHNPWGSSARRPCARWHPPAIGGQSHSCRVLITFMLRQAQHERSHGLFTTRKFAFSVAMPLLNRSTGASQSAILTVRLEPHDTPALPFAGASQNANLTVRLELVERWTGTPQLVPIRSYFDRLSTNGATASSPHESLHSASQCPHSTIRPEHHKKPSSPFAWSITIH